MPLKILIFVAVFACVFFLGKMIYPALETVFRKWQKKRIAKITPKLDSMFIDVPLKKLMLYDVLSPVVCGVLGFLFTQSAVIALVAAVVGLLIPNIIVKQLEAARRKKFSAQLVDGLLILCSCLKAGLSLMQSFEELAEEMPTPISQEFSLVIRQMQMGVSLEEAITSLKKRMRLDELDMVVTAMLVAKETGGDLIETFSRVITTIQERNKLLGRVKALCVQGKLQGYIMSALPILFGLFVYNTNPKFFDVFINEPIGRFLIGYAVISQILGMFFIKKLSKVDI